MEKPGGSEPLVRLEGVGKRFPLPGRGGELNVLEEVSLAVPRGAVVVVEGRSGAGKTTLLGLAGLLWRPTRGRVVFLGRETSGASPGYLCRQRREHLGFVFQHFALAERMPAWESVALPLVPRGLSLGERHRRAVRLLERLGLAGREGHATEELSGGEKQRVAVARALAGEPSLVVADEPLASVDPQTAELVLALLLEVRERGGALLVSGHDPLLLAAADLTLRLEGGRLGPVGEIG